jgi:predicted kinase
MKSYSQFIDEALLPSLIKAVARSAFRNKGLISKVASLEAKPIAKTASKIISKPAKITGFRTGGGSRGTNFDPMKGSKYTLDPKTQTTQSFTAPGHTKTPAGPKPRSDTTRFGSSKEIQTALNNRDIPSLRNDPKIGDRPLELWRKYPDGVEYTHGKFSKDVGGAKHVGSAIVDIQTKKGGSNLPLFGAQRKELKDRVKTGLQRPANIQALKKELGIKPMDSSNSSTTKKESVKEQNNFSDLISESNRKAQRASKSGKTPKEGPRSKGDDKPKAVVTVGLPGSGKSTIAKHMASKGKTDQHELDKSRQALGKGPAYFGQDIVKHTYDGAKKSAEQGKSTVLSNTSIPRQHRKDAIDKLKDSGYENVKAVLTPGSTKAAMRRNRKRTGSKPGEGAVPQFVMNRMAQGMKGMSRGERKELRGNYKELHKSERFTKPAMKRSGAIKEDLIQEGKKKELRKAFDQGLRDGRPEIVTKAPPESSAPTAPGSPERMAQIKREILGRSGGGKVVKAQKDKNNAFKKRRKEAIERIANKPKPKLNVTKVDAKKTFREFLEEAKRMRVLRTAHYNNSSAVGDIHNTGFRQGTRSDGAYHDKGMNVVYTTPSSRVGADYGSKRVNFKLVNPKVTRIDSPKTYGSRFKDWMRNASDDDLVNDRNRPEDSFKQSRREIRGGAKILRVPDAHGGHDQPIKGNTGSYIILDKETANKSIDKNPSPVMRAKGKERRTKTQPKKDT